MPINKHAEVLQPYLLELTKKVHGGSANLQRIDNPNGSVQYILQARGKIIAMDVFTLDTMIPELSLQAQAACIMHELMLSALFKHVSEIWGEQTAYEYLEA